MTSQPGSHPPGTPLGTPGGISCVTLPRSTWPKAGRTSLTRTTSPRTKKRYRPFRPLQMSWTGPDLTSRRPRRRAPSGNLSAAATPRSHETQSWPRSPSSMAPRPRGARRLPSRAPRHHAALNQSGQRQPRPQPPDRAATPAAAENSASRARANETQACSPPPPRRRYLTRTCSRERPHFPPHATRPTPTPSLDLELALALALDSDSDSDQARPANRCSRRRIGPSNSPKHNPPPRDDERLGASIAKC